MSNVKKVMRHMLREYYGIPAEGGLCSFHYVNPGFIKFDEKGGAQTESEAYVGDRNATVTVTGYENGWDFEAQYMKGDPVCEDLYDIAVNQRTGSDCERVLVSIDLNRPKEGGADGEYEARFFRTAVEANPPQGEPRSVVTMSGTIHQLGDFDKGVFDVRTKAFTPDGLQQAE